MSRLHDDLRAIGIFNAWNMSRTGRPVIAYLVEPSRSCIPSRWRLSIRGKPNIMASWYDAGGYSFTPWGRPDKANKLQDAIAKAQKLCPGCEMVKGPWRDTWVDKRDLDAAMEKVNARRKELKPQAKKVEVIE